VKPLACGIPEELRWRIWERDNFTCRRCGTRRYLTIDHVIPRSKGGSGGAGNLQTLCRACNSIKGAKLRSPLLETSALGRTIKAAGGVSNLAAKLKTTPQVIVHWRARGVPAERVLDVEEATGVTRHELRPDIFGKAPQQPA